MWQTPIFYFHFYGIRTSGFLKFQHFSIQLRLTILAVSMLTSDLGLSKSANRASSLYESLQYKCNQETSIEVISKTANIGYRCASKIFHKKSVIMNIGMFRTLSLHSPHFQYPLIFYNCWAAEFKIKGFNKILFRYCSSNSYWKGKAQHAGAQYKLWFFKCRFTETFYKL